MKHKRYKPTIKTQIFLSFGSIVSCLIILASAAYYYTAYNTFKKNYTTNSYQLSKIVSHQIEQYIDQINSLQKKILESDVIYDYVFEHSIKKDPRLDRIFHKNLYMVTGYDMIFYHLNIINLEENLLIPFGTYYNPSEFEATPDMQKNLINPSIALRGAKYIAPPSYGTLKDFNSNIETFSLIRSFPRYSDSLSEPKGILEIQMSLETIDDFIQEMLLSYDNKADSVFIFNSQNELIFPSTLPDEIYHYYTTLEIKEEPYYINPITNEKEIITPYFSKATGFTTLVVTPDSAFLTNKQFFRNICFFIVGISLLLLTTIIYHLSKNISLPIKMLMDNITELQLDSISDNSVHLTESNFNELEMLSNAYNHMQLRLKQSLEDIVHAKTLSMHSQIMALQAEMDSHFLYNTLSIIAIVAEENNDFKASEMCMKLTYMLRYITEDYASVTTFYKEVEHAKNYSDLMQIRFGEHITFQYDISPKLHSLSIPRLIIQPLIENSIKYARDEQPNLIISIRAYLKEGYWYTRITDNGTGFTEQSIRNIYDKIEKVNFDTKYPQLTIDGMGLANIYLRLKLFYENNFIFDIDTKSKGASILIGGKITNEKT